RSRWEGFMSTCSSCGATVADGSAFCPACGKATAESAGATATTVPAARTTPDTERMRQAAVQAHGAFMSLGTEKITCLIGGVFGAIGSLLPFYSIPTDSLLGEATGSATSASLAGQ